MNLVWWNKSVFPKPIYSLLILCLALISCQAQIPADKPSCKDDAFDTKVSNVLSFTVPLKSVEELSKEDLSQYLILDTREKSEFDVSHIEGASYVGYDKFSLDSVKDVDKDQAIIVYCSIGYRSEKIGEKLQKAGFTNVKNLYGSLFEWVNQGNNIEDTSGESTTAIHTYSKKWSKWVINQAYKKVW